MELPLKHELKSADQHTIPLYVYQTQQQNKKGIIQIVHGMCEHYLYYVDFIKYFNALGYDIFIHDQRGHGSAVNTTDDLGFLANTHGDKKLIDDTLVVCEYIRSINHNHSIILFGHSMGALVAQSAAAMANTNKNKQNYYSCLILTGTPGVAPSWQCKLGKLLLQFEICRQSAKKHAISPVAKFLVNYGFNFAFRKEKKLFSWTTSDQPWLDKFLADSKAGYVPQNQFWVDLIALLEFVKSESCIKNLNHNTPILFLDGSDDPVNNKTKQTSKMITKLKAYGMQSVKHVIYPNTRHHLCIEKNRDQIFTDIADELSSISHEISHEINHEISDVNTKEQLKDNIDNIRSTYKWIPSKR